VSKAETGQLRIGWHGPVRPRRDRREAVTGSARNRSQRGRNLTGNLRSNRRTQWHPNHFEHSDKRGQLSRQPWQWCERLRKTWPILELLYHGMAIHLFSPFLSQFRCEPIGSNFGQVQRLRRTNIQ